MNKHKLRNAAALTGILLAGSFFLAAPVSAYDPQAGARVHRDVIIERTHKDGATPADWRDLAKFRSGCRNADRAESDVSSGEGSERFRTRIIVCGDGHELSAATRARRVEALEKARAQLGQQSELDAGTRAQALATLDRELARLRAEAR